VTHDAAYERLPDLLLDRDDRELLAHVRGCHACQRQLFLLSRVDRLLRGRRPARRPGAVRLLRLGGAAAAAAAIAALLVVTHARGAQAASFALRSDSGALLARARIEPADAQNESVALAANGLPARSTESYLLWTEGSDGDPALVGRFMVNHRGECRARFNLPGAHHGGRFWITPSQEPAAIVAST
jgi:hypothetical protein